MQPYHKNEETARQDYIDNVLMKTKETEEYRLELYGQCQQCGKPNTFFSWCNTCNAARFRDAFSTWTSGNEEIDYFIQNAQIYAWDYRLVLEWYPWEMFSYLEKIGEGGYGI